VTLREPKGSRSLSRTAEIAGFTPNPETSDGDFVLKPPPTFKVEERPTPASAAPRRKG